MSQIGEEATTVEDALRELIETYHDLNPSSVDEVWEEPSALEFMQYVARNRPFVIRQGAALWSAVQQWSADYLSSAVGHCDVNVAITPSGPRPVFATPNADSVLKRGNDSLCFIKPFERNESFHDLITYIRKQEISSKDGPVKYGQTQNDNLRNEYISLFSDVPSTGPPFARIALGKSPEAINFWLGNSQSVTSMHKDNYENIYAQIRGQKHFVLLPPIASPAVNEQPIPAATYVVRSGKGEGDEIAVDDLEAKLDDPADDVRWALWDPDMPDERATPYSKLVQPLRVTLNEGDLLYLPALWYHKVSQSCGNEGFCCAVNYWYDMEFAGPFWASNAFIRDVAKAAARKQ